MRHPATLYFVALLCLSIGITVSVRASQETAPASTPLLPANTSGEEIYRQACAARHNVDGSGQSQTIVGFQLPLPNGHRRAQLPVVSYAARRRTRSGVFGARCHAR